MEMGMVGSNGRCYCQHEVWASCTINYRQYTAYEFEQGPNEAPPPCHMVTFETSSSHSWAKTAGSITVDGYGVLPSTCHDSTGASCYVNVCSSSLKVTTRTGDGWLFKVKVQGMDITANGASHVNSTATSYHRWGELDDDEADISQEWAFPHSAPWCKTDNSWGSCSCYLTNNIRLWYGDTINRQIDFVLNRRCGPPGGLRLGSKFPSSIWLTSTFFTSPNAQYGEYVATGEFWNSRPMYRRTFSSSPTSGYTLALSGSAPDLASGETSWRLVRYSKAEGQRRMLTWPCRADIGQNLFCISAAAQIARIGTISIRLDAPPSVEVQCHVVTFETSSSHSWAKTAGSIAVDGYGVLPSTCHDSTGASCDVNVCSNSLKVATLTGDGWLFKVKVQGKDITANGASHVNSTATSYHR